VRGTSRKPTTARVSAKQRVPNFGPCMCAGKARDQLLTIDRRPQSPSIFDNRRQASAVNRCDATGSAARPESR
jgi:hypothetical protein